MRVSPRGAGGTGRVGVRAGVGAHTHAGKDLAGELWAALKADLVEVLPLLQDVEEVDVVGRVNILQAHACHHVSRMSC